MLLKKIIPCLVVAFLVACGDDGGNSTSPSESTSSSDNLTIPKGWDWNVPKDARLNPEITYGTMTDERDGKVYKTIKIGDQTWMAENLNYADSAKTPSLLKRSWCYDGVAKNCDVAGRLYTWSAAIDSVKLANDADNPLDCGSGKTCTLPAKVQGICPTGWHLPTSTEWETLFTTVGIPAAAGQDLKSQTGWNNNGNGTDVFGFSALPTGGAVNYLYFYDVGYDAYFWSATEGRSDGAYRMNVHCDYNLVSLQDCFKSNGIAVRCLKD